MADLDAIERALRNADAAGDTEAATTLARAYREGKAASNYSNEGRSHPLVNPDADSGTLGRYAAGFQGGANRIRVGINDFLDKANASLGVKNILPPEAQAEHAADRQKWSNQAEQYEATKDQLGTAGFVGDITPEIAATAIPIAKGGALISRGASMLPRALNVGRYAPAVGDIVANAAYSGGKQAAENYAQGRDVMEGVDEAALTGGGGAAAGRVLFRTLAGMKPLASKSAQQLIERGVIPSPGQLFDGPIGNVIRNTEDRLAGLPGVGDVIQYARKRSVGDFNRVKINDAIAPTGSTVGGAGIDAVEQAQQKISQTFERGLEGMHMPADDVLFATDAAKHLIPQSTPMLDESQVAKLTSFIEHRLEREASMGNHLDGETAKALDSEIGYMARKYSRSVSPSDHSLGDAFYELQKYWRFEMSRGSDPAKTELLNAANAAYKNMLPIVKAADKASAQGGVFTPNQLQRSLGPYGQRASEFDRAAQAVLPSRVPDSGTAGRYLLGAALGGGAAITGPIAGATLAASILYTRAGSKLLLNGLPGLGRASIDYLSKLAPDKLVSELARMHAKYAYLREPIANAVRQASAQAGRMNAQQPEMQP